MSSAVILVALIITVAIAPALLFIATRALRYSYLRSYTFSLVAVLSGRSLGPVLNML